MSQAKQTVDAYIGAMQRGVDGVDDLVGLFAEDGEYVEPFGGELRRHVGRDAIRANFETSMANRPPDLKIRIGRVDVAGEEVVADWICESPAFDAPVHGRDRYLIRDGQIVILKTEFL